MPNYNNDTYEFVDREIWKKENNEFQKVINEFQKSLRKDHRIRFQFYLVGSAKKRLVTQKTKNNNKGYDFDYRLLLSKCSPLDPKEIKDWFMLAMNKALEKFQLDYEPVENKSQSIRIKLLDKESKKIQHSFDFVIIKNKATKIGTKTDLQNANKNNDTNEKSTYELLFYDKEKNCYEWQERSDDKDYKSQLQAILVNGNNWEKVRKKYLQIKNANLQPMKKSFSLYYEAIESLYQELCKNDNLKKN